MKHLILIHSNLKSRQIWEGFSDAQRAEGWRKHFALVEELTESGELVLSEGLAGPGQSKRVTVHEGRTLTSDGPFAESKEYLAGFFLIDCEGFDRALEVAARIPEAAHGLVYVRPVLDSNGLEI